MVINSTGKHIYATEWGNMKKLLFLLTLFFLGENARAGETIKITYFHAPPHIIYDSRTRQVSGALYDFLNKDIAPLMDAGFVWDTAPVNVPRELVLLEDGDRDAVSLLVYTPERARKFSYTEKPYAQAIPVIGVMNNSRLTKIEKVEDLLPYTIGYTSGYYVSPFMRDSRLKFELVTSGKPNFQNLSKMKAGRIDCIYIPDKMSLLMGYKMNNMENNARVIQLPEPSRGMHVVFGKNKKDLAEKYNESFNRLDGTAAYLKRVSKYIEISKL